MQKMASLTANFERHASHFRLKNSHHREEENVKRIAAMVRPEAALELRKNNSATIGISRMRSILADLPHAKTMVR
jgi:hypothetical protein